MSLMFINFYGQHYPHDDVHIASTRIGLLKLSIIFFVSAFFNKKMKVALTPTDGETFYLNTHPKSKSMLDMMITEYPLTRNRK